MESRSWRLYFAGAPPGASDCDFNSQVPEVARGEVQHFNTRRFQPLQVDLQKAAAPKLKLQHFRAASTVIDIHTPGIASRGTSKPA